MVANPMQKMKRNSMLTGTIIGLIIGLILCVILYLFLTSQGTTGGIAKGDAVTVHVLNKTIKAGAVVTVADIVPKVMSRTDIPTDAVTLSSDAVAKIDLTTGTILTTGMLNQTANTTTADLREQEYNMITLPTQLAAGDFIDIRLQLPSGGDYIVISKKQVLDTNASTVWLQMKEDEILTMSNAIIEYYIMTGSKLYATKYTDPGIQTASTPTYCPNTEVYNLLRNNVNITTQITDGEGRLANSLKELRNNFINRELNGYAENRLENIEEKIQEEVQTLKQSREGYFGTLDGVNAQ